MTLFGILLAAAVAAMAGALALQSRSARDASDARHAREQHPSLDQHWYREFDPFVLAVLFFLVGLSLTAIVIATRLI